VYCMPAYTESCGTPTPGRPLRPEMLWMPLCQTRHSGKKSSSVVPKHLSNPTTHLLHNYPTRINWHVSPFNISLLLAEDHCRLLTKFVWPTNHLYSKSLCSKPRGHLSRTGHIEGRQGYVAINTVPLKFEQNEHGRNGCLS
jgi:hypothetical protein